MRSKCYVYILAVNAIVESLFFGVMYAGWGSYVYVLIDSGIYSELCRAGVRNTTTQDLYPRVAHNSTYESRINNHSYEYFTVTDDGLVSKERHASSCKAQQEQLHILYTTSIGIIFFLVVFWGPLVYRLGVTWPKLLSIVMISCGCLMLGFVHPGIPLLIVPGMVFVGLGGVGLMVINLRVSSLLTVGGGFFVAILSGACDSSVLTLRVVKEFYDKGLSFKYPLIGFAVLEIFLSGTSLILHRIFEKNPPTVDTMYEEKMTNEITVDQVEMELTSGLDTENVADNQESHVSLRRSVCSPKTITFYLSLSVWVFNFLFYVGSINSRLTASFPDKVSHFTNILAYIMLCGIITASLPGLVFEGLTKLYKHRRIIQERQLMPSVYPPVITTVLGFILNILAFYTSEAVFLVEFVVVTLFRSFLYSTAVSFSVSAYPLRHQSTVFSLGLAVGGLFSMIQIPLFMWYNTSPASQLKVHIFMTTLLFVTLIHPVRVYMEAKDLTLMRCCLIRKPQHTDKESNVKFINSSVTRQ